MKNVKPIVSAVFAVAVVLILFPAVSADEPLEINVSPGASTFQVPTFRLPHGTVNTDERLGNDVGSIPITVIVYPLVDEEAIPREEWKFVTVNTRQAADDALIAEYFAQAREMRATHLLHGYEWRADDATATRSDRANVRPEACQCIKSCSSDTFLDASSDYCRGRGGVSKISIATDNQSASVKCADGTRVTIVCCGSCAD